ncbi:hypothetical protein B0T09DRAFT_334750 [Sordaria sp. MPI-SDFR-AT-0083]|nr:hypothetical protein B0T09DRAFT_334750 [Sordaria sp. MPI-SDFR-AT-0083]
MMQCLVHNHLLLLPSPSLSIFVHMRVFRTNEAHTYGHRWWKTRDPVRSPINKPLIVGFWKVWLAFGKCGWLLGGVVGFGKHFSPYVYHFRRVRRASRYILRLYPQISD